MHALILLSFSMYIFFIGYQRPKNKIKYMFVLFPIPFFDCDCVSDIHLDLCILVMYQQWFVVGYKNNNRHRNDKIILLETKLLKLVKVADVDNTLFVWQLCNIVEHSLLSYVDISFTITFVNKFFYYTDMHTTI